MEGTDPYVQGGGGTRKPGPPKTKDGLYCTPSVRKEEEAVVPDNGFPNKWGRGRRGNGIAYSYTSPSHTNAATECLLLLHFPPAEQFPPRAHVTRIQNRSFLLPQPEPLRVRPRPPAHPGARLPRPLIGARSRVPPPGGDADHGRARRTARSPSAPGGGGGHGIARRGAGDLALSIKGLLFLFLFFSFQDPETEAQTKNALVYISVRRR